MNCMEGPYLGLLDKYYGGCDLGFGEEYSEKYPRDTTHVGLGLNYCSPSEANYIRTPAETQL